MEKTLQFKQFYSSQLILINLEDNIEIKFKNLIEMKKTILKYFDINPISYIYHIENVHISNFTINYIKNVMGDDYNLLIKVE